MKHLQALAFLTIASVPQPTLSQVPTVTLDWVGIYELSACRQQTDPARHLRARAEVEERLANFQRIWAEQGPLLLKTATEVTGQPFRYREALAVLHVCEDQFSGISYPLLINPKWFLKAYDGQFAEHPLHDSMFAELMFHEILHRYIRDALGPGKGEPFRSSALMRRYSQEQLMTRTHLHLFAIERAVYQRLGKLEIVAMTRQYGREWPAYVRAHEIVDELGVDAVLEDFRSAAAERRANAN